MNTNDILSLLTSLDSVPGVSGHEEAVGERISRLLRESIDDEWRDAVGNRFFLQRGKDPTFKILLCAHMDEIGFMVSDIDDEGYVHVLPVGFHDPRLLLNQQMTIETQSGHLQAVTGSGKPPHELKGCSPPAFQFSDLRLDVGAHTPEEAQEMGIATGDIVYNSRQSLLLGKHTFCGRAVDNRAGCAAMIAALRLLSEMEHRATVVACASVQEELGVKGARAAGHALAPSIALSLDVCFGAVDRAITPSHSRVYLGKGPAIQAYDWSPGSLLGNVVPSRLWRRLAQSALQHHIPYQLEVTLDGGTDAAEISFSGNSILTGGINIPNRYMHSSVGTVDLRDVLDTARLTAAFIRELKGPIGL